MGNSPMENDVAGKSVAGRSLPGWLLRCIGAVVSGLLFAICFPSPGWGSLGAVALVPWLLALRGLDWWRRGLLSMLAGVVFAGVLIYWLIYVHPAAPFLLSLWFALWFGLFGILAGPLRRPRDLVLWMPVAWTAVEYLRSIGALGFGWGLLGHTQWENLPLIQLASVTGAYGISFLLAMLNGSLAAFPLWYRSGSFPQVKLLAVPFVILLVVVLAGNRSLATAGKSNEGSIRLALLQVCFSQLEKWEEGDFDRVKNRTYRMSAEAAAEDVDLVVWPETALPLALNEYPLLEFEMVGEIKDREKPVLVGSLLNHGTTRRPRLCNAVMLFRPETLTWEDAPLYEKMHLVPWGEYVPFKRILPFVDRLVTAEGGGALSPGKGFTVFDLDGRRFGVPICFESAVAGLVRHFPAGGANLLINVTNDAWFRESGAQEQHAIQSVFRAVENRRAVARAANTGLTCWISPVGRIEETIPLYREGILIAEVPLRSDRTFYTRYGDLFGRGVVAVAAFILIIRYVQRRRREREGGLRAKA